MSWREIGSPRGRPVVHAHGGLLSGAYVASADGACRRLGIRLLTPDRPGIGRSSPQPDRTLAHWVRDVAELLDHLEIAKAGAHGWSMGGQYAMALAALAQDRFDALVVVAGAVPLDDPGARADLDPADRRLTAMAEEHPRRAEATFRIMGSLARHLPGMARRSIVKPLSTDDARVSSMLDPHLLPSAMAEGMAEPSGMVEEYRAWARPWGFEMETIVAPSTIYRGQTDALIPESWADEIAAGVGGIHVPVPHAGHLFLLTDWGRVLSPFLTA